MRKEALIQYFPKFTLHRYQKLIKAFSTLEKAWQAEFDELRKTGWRDELIHEFLLWRDNINESNIQETLEREHIKIITQKDDDYPKILLQIYDPPVALFVRGTLKKEEPSIAVVGSRKNTVYGKQVVDEIVGELSRNGITIISGLALGIDALAHKTTLQNNGRTIAVLGGGIDNRTIAPRYNAFMAKEIIEKGGAVISEYPPETQPTRFTFPQRNRIIAGLALGTLVIEAGEKSGTLITAQCALDSNRDVFAVPNNIFHPSAKGTNNLLKFGAKIVTSANDILETLNISEFTRQVVAREIIPDSPTEAKILLYLSKEPIHIDVITQKSTLQSHIVSSTLTLMEMKGKVKNLGGMNYVICS
jgi:DNA processing protein